MYGKKTVYFSECKNEMKKLNIYTFDIRARLLEYPDSKGKNNQEGFLQVISHGYCEYKLKSPKLLL